MSTSSILSLLTWSFLPNYISNILLTQLNTSPLLISRGLWVAHPQGTPGWIHNKKLVFTFVLSSYFLYSVIMAIKSTGSGGGMNWYQVLGVSRDVSDAGINRAYRGLSLIYHPDKKGGDERVFGMIREAKEGLMNPVLREVYERFGPGVIRWKENGTLRDHMSHGLKDFGAWYLITGGIQGLLMYFRKSEGGVYWRIYLYILLFTCELSLITYPSSKPPSILSLLFPSRLNYQHVALLRQLWITSSLAINQIFPIWAPTSSPTLDGNVRDPQLDEQLTKMLQQTLGMTKDLEVSTVATWERELKVLRGGEEDVDVERIAKKEMEQMLIDDILKSHPATRDSWKQATT